MIVEPNCRVVMNYKVSREDGETLESSEQAGPIEVVHGVGQIVPGLDKALAGMSPGEEKQVVVAPGEAYGERDEEAVLNVPKSSFPDDKPLEVGMLFHMMDPSGGGVRFATVKELMGEEVKVDFNHPLAGETLHFDIKIEDVLEPDPNAGGCGCGCGSSAPADDCGGGCGPGGSCCG